jgi:hypothetical protein
MGWTWRYERTDGTPVDPLPEGAVTEAFPSQSEAESWVGEVWRDLLDAGVDQVTLLEEERVVYGPMSLHPPQS